MRICVFGAGAVGGHIAARLAAGAADVSIVARGEHLQAIQMKGLTVRHPDGVLAAKVRASENPADLGPQDAVIISVKSPSLAQVAPVMQPLLGPTTVVAFALNGIPWWYFYKHGGELDGRRLPRLDPGDTIWNTIGPERSLGTVIYSACEVHEPGVITVDSPNNRLIIGEPDGSLSERAQALAETLERGGFTTTVTAEIRKEIWTKLMNNISSGTMAILTGMTVKDVYADPVRAAAGRQMLVEASAIARALSCETGADLDKKIEHQRNFNHRPSILQDLMRGRPMEVEAMLAAPLDMARMAGVETPVLDLMVSLAKLRASGAGLYDG